MKELIFGLCIMFAYATSKGIEAKPTIEGFACIAVCAYLIAVAVDLFNGMERK